MQLTISEIVKKKKNVSFCERSDRLCKACFVKRAHIKFQPRGPSVLNPALVRTGMDTSSNIFTSTQN
jgi:hypothetical protein